MKIATLINIFDADMRTVHGSDWYVRVSDAHVSARASAFAGVYAGITNYTQGNIVTRLKNRHKEVQLEKMIDGN